MDRRNTGARVLSLLLILSLLSAALPWAALPAQAAGGNQVRILVRSAPHCKIYFSEKQNGDTLSSGLTELKEGETLLREGMAWPCGAIFFVAPEEGYALCRLEASGSQGNYFAISNG